MGYCLLYPFFFGRAGGGGWREEIEVKAKLSFSQSCELKLELRLAKQKHEDLQNTQKDTSLKRGSTQK